MKKVSLGTALLMSAAAAGAALLLAPKSGEKLRKELKEKSQELKWEAEAKKNELVQDFKESYQEAEAELASQDAWLAAERARLDQTMDEISAELTTEG